MAKTVDWVKHTLVVRIDDKSQTPLEVRVNHGGKAITVRNPSSPGHRATLPVSEFRRCDDHVQAEWARHIASQRAASRRAGRRLIYASNVVTPIVVKSDAGQKAAA